jgi:hypothetical protein
MPEFHVTQLKAEARHYARSGTMKYRAALDHLARVHGFSHWNGLLESEVHRSIITNLEAPPSDRKDSTVRPRKASIGKAGTRYRSDVEFRAAIDEELSQARRETRPAVWTTYCIHDPSTPDLEEHPDGLRTYVGQTKAFDKRVSKWLKLAGAATADPAEEITGLLYRLMVGGIVPRFRVLSRTGSAIDSLVSETNWARKLINSGYTLANKWDEHRVGGDPVDRYGVPKKRLWEMTWEDAIGSRIHLLVTSKDGRHKQMIDFTHFPPRMRLSEIRSSCLQRLEQLGHSGAVRIIVE